MPTLTLRTKVLDDYAGAANDFARVPLPIDFAKTSPGSEDFGVTDFDEVDVVLRAKGLNELDVLCLCAGFDENTEMGFASVESLGGLTKAPRETVVNESILQNLLGDT